MDPLTNTLLGILIPLASKFINVVSTTIVDKLNFKLDKTNKRLIVSLDRENEENPTTTHVQRLDDAKNSLIESLQAIEELKKEAALNQAEADRLLQTLANLQGDKVNLEKEMQDIKNLITTDVTAFRKVAGLSEADIQKERLLGFISGILASIIASALIASTVWGFNAYIKPAITEQEPTQTSEPSTKP